MRNAAKVFQSIGAYPKGFLRGSGKGHLYLWDALCDRTNGMDVGFDDVLFRTSDHGKEGRRGLDFRSPENLNMYLISNEALNHHSWPLLQIYLEARMRKRVELLEVSEKYNKEDPLAYFQLTYLSKKLYGDKWEEVSKTDAKKKTIEKLVYSSDQIWKF